MPANWHFPVIMQETILTKKKRRMIVSDFEFQETSPELPAKLIRDFFGIDGLI